MSKFDTNAPEFLDSPLAQIYFDLRSTADERTGKPFTHNVALWVAWMSHRQQADGFNLLGKVGLPSTAVEFAAVVGVSDRTLRKYGEHYPEMVERAQAKAVRLLLGNYRLAVVQALGQSASIGDEANRAADRRTFLQLTGDLVTRQDVTSGDKPLAPLVQVYLPANGREELPDYDDDIPE